MKTSDTGGGIVLLLFGGFTSLLSLQLPIGTFRAAMSGLFPFCLGLLLVLLAGLFLVNLGLQAKATGPRLTPAAEMPVSRKQLVLFLGAMALATLLFTPLGYPLNASLLMAALLRTLGLKRWSLNLLLSGITAGAPYVLFVRWLDIPLPKGWLGL